MSRRFNQHEIVKNKILSKALLNAAQEMGIGMDVLNQIIDEDCSAIGQSGITPETKSGERALMLIRCYQSLYSLVGGDPEQIKHWIHVFNKGIKGVPAEKILEEAGLIQVVSYLDAMQEKI